MKIVTTLAGFGAMILWAMAPLVFCELDNIPTFQVSGLVLMIAFFFMTAKLTLKREWKKVRQPFQVWAVGFMIILSNQAAYVYAMKLIPPEQAEIIYYLWPIFLVVITNVFIEKKRTLTPILASLLGFTGIYLLLHEEGVLGEQITADHIMGYSSALIAAVAWMVYSLYSKHNSSIPLEMNGMWCGLAAVCCFFLHSFFEAPQAITLFQWGMLIFVGGGILSLSLFLWSMGMRHGYMNILSVSAYLTPVISVSMLVMCGRTPFKEVLLISANLVLLGGILCAAVEWIGHRKSKELS